MGAVAPSDACAYLIYGSGAELHRTGCGAGRRDVHHSQISPSILLYFPDSTLLHFYLAFHTAGKATTTILLYFPDSTDPKDHPKNSEENPNPEETSKESLARPL